MKVFISWSGDNSKKLAEEFNTWLPNVLQAVKTYFTPDDIEKGTRWNEEISKELDASEFGILFVTRDNIKSEWIMFEAGALSKKINKSFVCPILFGIQNTDLAGPLRQFQTTEFNRDDIYKLVNLINGKLGDRKLVQKTLESVFSKWWPDLESNIKDTISAFDNTSDEPIRTERDLLEEILTLSRLNSNLRPRIINPKAIPEIMNVYIRLHEDQVGGVGGYQNTLDMLKELKNPLLHICRQYKDGNPRMQEFIDKIEDMSFTHTEKQEDLQNDDDLPF